MANGVEWETLKKKILENIKGDCNIISELIDIAIDYVDRVPGKCVVAKSGFSVSAFKKGSEKELDVQLED